MSAAVAGTTFRPTRSYTTLRDVTLPAHLPAALRATVRRAGARIVIAVIAVTHPTLHDSRHSDLRGPIGCPDGTGCRGRPAVSRIVLPSASTNPTNDGWWAT